MCSNLFHSKSLARRKQNVINQTTNVKITITIYESKTNNFVTYDCKIDSEEEFSLQKDAVNAGCHFSLPVIRVGSRRNPTCYPWLVVMAIDFKSKVKA